MLMTPSQQVFLALYLSGTVAQVFVGKGSSDPANQLQSGIPNGLSAACSRDTEKLCEPFWVESSKGLSGFNFTTVRALPPLQNLTARVALATFNETVNCASTLPLISSSAYHPTQSELGDLCTTDCLQSLDNFRTKQLGSCSADVVTSRGSVYPPTIGIDTLLFTYNYTCKRDSASKAFCAPLVDAWGDEPTPAKNESCSDCVLGTLQIELDSPFGYDANLAQNFSSLTSSCGASNYPVTSPPPYTASGSHVSATTSATRATSTSQSCTNKYTIKSGDTCNSVSIAQKVSTFSLLYENGLQGYCTNFPTQGSICLPHTCDVYTVVANDTCYGITQAVSRKQSVSIAQLISWNLNINRDCSNLNQLAGYQICTSFPGDTAAAAASNPVTQIAPRPTNVPAGTNTNCAKYYNISTGDTCASVTLAQSISLPDFYFLNPEINATTCANLQLGESYCVKPVGDIASYPGYGRPNPSGPVDPCRGGFSLPASCYVTTYPTASAWTWPSATSAAAGGSSSAAASSVAVTGPLALAAGTKADCSVYDQYYPTASAGKGTSDNINGCYAVATFHEVTVQQFTQWNPSLKFDTANPSACALSPGFRYCAGVGGAPSASASPSITTTAAASTTQAQNPTSTAVTSPTGVKPPGPTQSGIAPTCNSYTLVASGGSCAAIEAKYTITFAQFLAWNPAVGTNCENLWVGEAYCVGVAK